MPAYLTANLAEVEGDTKSHATNRQTCIFIVCFRCPFVASAYSFSVGAACFYETWRTIYTVSFMKQGYVAMSYRSASIIVSRLTFLLLGTAVIKSPRIAIAKRITALFGIWKIAIMIAGTVICL